MMKRNSWMGTLVMVLAVALLMSWSAALAQDYYTLPELREQATQGWHETYKDKYGRETVVDIDIDVFGEDKAPVLKAGYPGYEAYRYSHNEARSSIMDAKLKKGGKSTYLYRTSNGEKINLDRKYGEGYGNDMTPQEAYLFFKGILEEQGFSYLEYIYDRPQQFDVLCSIKPKTGEVLATPLYYFGLWPKLHELPIMTHIGLGYVKYGVGPLGDPVSSFEIRNKDEYSVKIKPFVEQEKLADDIPLCSLNQVLQALEKQILAGHIQNVRSLRFGYVLYNDPEIPTDEQVSAYDVESWYLVPSWVLECDYSEDPKKDCREDVPPRMVIANAQTGAFFDPLDESVKFHGRSGETRYQGFISWDDVK